MCGKTRSVAFHFPTPRSVVIKSKVSTSTERTDTMKLSTIVLTALLALSNKGEASLRGTAPEKQRRLGDSQIEVSFNGIRVERVSGVDAGDEEEWDLEFKVEAFSLDIDNLAFDRITDDDDSFAVTVPENDLGDYIAIDGETTVNFDESEWGNEDIRLYKISVTGTELDISIDENDSPDDPLPSCSRVFMHQGRRFRESVTCSSSTHEFTVYFRVDED